MDVPFFLALFVLSHLLLLHSLSAQEDNKIQITCPKSFDCKPFQPLSFPFSNSTYSQCGLCTVTCDEPNQPPKIRLGNEGPWYDVIPWYDVVIEPNISKNIYQIQIHDQILQSHLESRHCEAFTDLNFPEYSYISFTIYPSLTFFKCNKSSSNATYLKDYFKGFHTHKKCKDYNLYYKFPGDPLSSPDRHPPSCSVIHLPLKLLNTKNHNEDDPFNLLTHTFSLELHVSEDCQRCYLEGGQCQNDNQKFHCATTNKEGTKHRWILATGNSSSYFWSQYSKILRYVDVILQLIDKAGDFVSDDIWFRVVQFVTNNEDLQLYAAVKAREYLDKPAVHETMVKVSAYILGEYSHLLGRRPGCSPKEIFSIIHEKLPTVSTSTISILLSTYAKILMHNQPPDPELQNQIWAIFQKYESCIDVEIQQRAVEYFALSRKGADLVDILAEMPKFPERQSALIRKAEDTEADTAEQSATKLRSLHQTSNALVVTDQRPANGMPPVNQLGLVKVPNMSNVDHNSADQGVTEANGTLTVVDPQPLDRSADVLGDLLGPLAIEGPPHVAAQSEHNLVSGAEGAPNAEDALALAPVEEQKNTIQPMGNLAERFNALCLKDSGVLYEDPYIQIGIKAEWRAHQGRLVLFLGNKNIAPLVAVQAVILPPSHLKMELSLVPEVIPPRAQVQCPLEVVNLRPSRDVAVLDFSYNFGTHVVNVKVRLPVVLNKFLQPISVSAEEFFPQWRSLSGPPLKLQDVVRGVRPMSLAEMTNLFNSFRLLVCPGLDPNANNLVASTTFYSESTRAMLCLIRIETDPADRTQLRMTVASGDPTLTLELKEFIKEQLVSIPIISRAPGPATPHQAQPTSSPTAISDPGAMLAGLFQ